MDKRLRRTTERRLDAGKNNKKPGKNNGAGFFYLFEE
jgi:hypothetical protein